MRIALLLLVTASVASAEIIDRIVATVADTVVTRSDVMLQLRVRAFLDQQPLDVTVPEQKQAVDRLIEQALVRREVEITRYRPPDMADVDTMLEQLKQQRFPSDNAYQQELQKYGVTNEQMREALLWQLTVLRFVDYRFRPGIQVSNADVESYYQREIAQRAKTEGKDRPPLDEVRERIEEALTGQRVDEALSRWIAQARVQVRVKIYEGALQ